MKCWPLLLSIVLSALVIQPNEAQSPTNIFSFFFNSLFRRNRTRPPGFFSSTTTESYSEFLAAAAATSALTTTSTITTTDRPLFDRVTVTTTTTVISEIAPTETVSEFFTVTETLTERLIATSTMTRKMTATATHIVNTCGEIESTVDAIGSRRISWKEIPNRIDELLKLPSAVESVRMTNVPDGQLLIGRSVDIESSEVNHQPSELDSSKDH